MIISQEDSEMMLYEDEDFFIAEAYCPIEGVDFRFTFVLPLDNEVYTLTDVEGGWSDDV